MTYVRNFAYPKLMLGTPTNSTTALNGLKGVTVTAQSGKQDCFTEFTFTGLDNTPCVFRVDVWGVTGDTSTLRNGTILIAQRSPWTTLGKSDMTSGTAVVRFTPKTSFLIRLACPDGGQAVYTQPLLMPEADWEKTVRPYVGGTYFDGDLMPLN